MTMPMGPTEETQIIRKQIGYSWSFSYEYGATGNRQKLILTGNTVGMARALTELKRAKINLMGLATATAEELAKPLPYEAYKKKEEEGNDRLY